MTGKRLTTTQRGLGYSHQAEGKRQRAALTDGTPCPRCGRGMYRGQQLDLDDFPGRWYGGPQVKLLSHRSCNRRAGAQLGNMLRGINRQLAKARRR